MTCCFGIPWPISVARPAATSAAVAGAEAVVTVCGVETSKLGMQRSASTEGTTSGQIPISTTQIAREMRMAGAVNLRQKTTRNTIAPGKMLKVIIVLASDATLVPASAMMIDNPSTSPMINCPMRR